MENKKDGSTAHVGTENWDSVNSSKVIKDNLVKRPTNKSPFGSNGERKSNEKIQGIKKSRSS